MTPLSFDALMKRAKAEREREDRRTALISWSIFAANSDPDKFNLTVDDFMPKMPAEKQTPEQMFTVVEMLNAAFGGKVVEM